MDIWANASQANIRFLQQRTQASKGACQDALRQVNGNLMDAVRLLNPSLPTLKYHDMYYLRHWERVEEPDQDLPRCDFMPVGGADLDREQDRNISGERLIAPFNDGNSLNDILGGLGVADGYNEYWDDTEKYIYPTIQGLLMEVADRIREKLRRNKNAYRAELFGRAVLVVETAKDLFFDHRYDEAKERLWEAQRLLEDGNKKI